MHFPLQKHSVPGIRSRPLEANANPFIHLFNLDLDPTASHFGFILETALWKIDPQQAPVESGLELLHLHVFGQSECSSPRTDFSLGQEHGRHDIGHELGFDGFSGWRAHDGAAVFGRLVRVQVPISHMLCP